MASTKDAAGSAMENLVVAQVRRRFAFLARAPLPAVLPHPSSSELDGDTLMIDFDGWKLELAHPVDFDFPLLFMLASLLLLAAQISTSR